VLLSREMGQEGAYFGHAHLAGMVLNVKQDMAPDPGDVSLLRAQGIVFGPQ
jgi:hypothetical protein